MKKLNLLFHIVILAVCSVGYAEAQTKAEVLITGEYTNVPIEQVLDQLESQYDIDVFFKKDELPDKMLTGSYTEMPLNEFLSSVFSRTATGFFIYRDTEVIIVPRQLVDEVYSAKYYQALEGSQEEEEVAVSAEENPTLMVGSLDQLSPTGKATVTGVLIDAQSNEEIIGATINWPEQGVATVTDEFGKFSATLEAGTHDMVIEYLGYQDLRKQMNIQSDGSINLELFKEAVSLDEVTIRGRSADASVDNVQISVATIDVKTIKKLPTFLGEADVIKSLLLNPGVSSIGEGATGFNVRGGEVDQNLVLQDEGFLFNSSHALGFFSTFNTDMINKVDLYKGNIPAEYGGRLASVMDVEMRNGNDEEFDMKGGVGPVSSRLLIEGPIIKNKTSFLIGGRASYTDWILKQIDVLEVRNSSATFYDLNARINHKFSQKHNLTLSGYFSKDEFSFNNEFGFDYSTVLGEASLRSILTDKLYSKFSVTYSKYASTQIDLNGNDMSSLDIDISYLKIKEDINYDISEKLKFNVGGEGILYTTEPGILEPTDASSIIQGVTLDQENGLEAAVYGSAEVNLTDALLISAGVRMSLFQFLGPATIFSYEDPENPTTNTITGSELKEGTISTYSNLEPRFSARLKLSENGSFKAGYSRTAQYFNQIFNSDSPTPSSQWQLATPYVKPNLSHNFSAGYFHNLKDNNWETSFEVYYRDIDRLFDYRDFAQLIANEHIETELLSGIGRAYGAELSLKRKLGTWNGWLSYTYSKSERQVLGINRGDWYSSNFDKPHDFSLILNFNPNQRHTLSFNFNYSTGRPTTPPIGNFETSTGLVVPIYSERNEVRIPDYHRLDVAYTIGQGYKKNAKFKTSVTFSIYNLYGRKNAFSVFFTQGAFNRAQANRLAVLGSAFPSVTFNFEFL